MAAEARYDQLIFELYVRDLESSIGFYEQFGFSILRREGHFVELQWGPALLFLEETERAPTMDGRIVGNVRVLVPDVDRYWDLAQRLGVPVILPIENRYYGMRDFTIAGPDGIGLRFASWLGEPGT
jgi:catechol 2,3-dioxygenase-like lactoylglutathione lyase family enzyme